jgi:hypothetical protein
MALITVSVIPAKNLNPCMPLAAKYKEDWAEEEEEIERLANHKKI